MALGASTTDVRNLILGGSCVFMAATCGIGDWLNLRHARLLFYHAEHMGRREHLGEFEVIVLLAVVRLGEDAYGVPVRREIETRTGRSLTVGALYRTLDRLEEKGYVESWFSEPIAERGGRSKRYFRVLASGLRALEQSHRELSAMWEGLDLGRTGKNARHA